MRTKNIEVTHNPEEHRFELTVDGHLAVLDYMLTGNIIIFLHTEVPPVLGGRGLGVNLVEAWPGVCQGARAEGQVDVLVCEQVSPAASGVSGFVEVAGIA